MIHMEKKRADLTRPTLVLVQKVVVVPYDQQVVPDVVAAVCQWLDRLLVVVNIIWHREILTIKKILMPGLHDREILQIKVR